MSSQSKGGSGGVGFLGLLGLLFIGLKLGGVIQWPWWAVLAPIWGPMAVLFLFGFGFGVLLVGAALIDVSRKKNRMR